jgi:hypothetical protein
MEFKRYALLLITSLTLTAATGCVAKHALWNLPEIKAAAKAITVLPPKVDIKYIDGETLTADTAADTALSSFITDELAHQLKPEFGVSILNRGAITYDSLFTSGLKDLFAALDVCSDISEVELGESIRNIFTLGQNDLYLIMATTGYYHSKRDSIRAAAGSAISLGIGFLAVILSGADFYLYPHFRTKLTEGITGCVVLSKSRNCAVFYDINHYIDCPTDEADARWAVVDILHKFLITIQDLNVHRVRHVPSTGINNKRQ